MEEEYDPHFDLADESKTQGGKIYNQDKGGDSTDRSTTGESRDGDDMTVGQEAEGDGTEGQGSGTGDESDQETEGQSQQSQGQSDGEDGQESSDQQGQGQQSQQQGQGQQSQQQGQGQQSQQQGQGEQGEQQGQGEQDGQGEQEGDKQEEQGQSQQEQGKDQKDQKDKKQESKADLLKKMLEKAEVKEDENTTVDPLLKLVYRQARNEIENTLRLIGLTDKTYAYAQKMHRQITSFNPPLSKLLADNKPQSKKDKDLHRTLGELIYNNLHGATDFFTRMKPQETLKVMREQQAKALLPYLQHYDAGGLKITWTKLKGDAAKKSIDTDTSLQGTLYLRLIKNNVQAKPVEMLTEVTKYGQTKVGQEWLTKKERDALLRLARK